MFSLLSCYHYYQDSQIYLLHSRRRRTVQIAPIVTECALVLLKVYLITITEVILNLVRSSEGES